ncbi:MAG: translation initiation factor IF-2 [Candidatus Thermoplasmatota archaeon]
MYIRQPIVTVLGHVDHGKTTFLDRIRGTNVADKEPGKITQHIGATEVQLETILKKCGSLADEKKFKIPGLLFIDTPGHHAFLALRSRGGALADLGVVIIDINEGIMPQTNESLNVLRRNKVPFVIALNKIDLISGWKKNEDVPFVLSYCEQVERVKEELDKEVYGLIEELHAQKIPCERFDKIEDFTKNVAIVPISAKTGEGISDILLVLIGLAQKYLEKNLRTEECPGEGTIIEVKEERGLGKTIDVILYSGKIKKGDAILVGGEPIVSTKIRAIFKKVNNNYISVRSVKAAAGIKLSAQNIEHAVSGAPLRVLHGEKEKIIEEMRKDMEIKIETESEGVVLKADAIGSLEAIAFELKNAGIPIKKYGVGDISNRDLVDADLSLPAYRVVLGFNVNVLPDVSTDVKTICNDVIYKLVEEYLAWAEQIKKQVEKERREEIVHPGVIKVLPNCIFRVSKPAIFGVRILAGRIKVGQSLLREDGLILGRIKSIRVEDQSLKEAIVGSEVAIAVDGITIGRQVKVEDILYIDIPEEHAKALAKIELSIEEKEALEKVYEIKRKEKPFWGM